MHLLSTMLLFWAGVSAASLVAAVLVVAVEVRTTAQPLHYGLPSPEKGTMA